MSDMDLYKAVKFYSELTRCSDCKYFRAYTDGIYGNCTRSVNRGAVYRKNDYCSYAERPLPAHDDHDVSGLIDD